jgi:hypothetical protein
MMASTSTDGPPGTFSIARVFARGSRAFAGNPAVMLVIALLCGALPNNGLSRLIQPFIGPWLLGGGTGVLLFWTLSIALGSFIGVVSQAAMTRAVAINAVGGRARLGEALWSGLTVIVPLFGLAALIAIGATIGVMLLIVPGLFLLVLWSVAASALIEEREGIVDALYRSAWLTKGARLRILGIELVLFAIGLAGTLLITTLSMAVLRGWVTIARFGATGATLWYLVPTLVIHTLLYAYVPAVKAALYVELREWKEGPQTDTLAEVFA